MFLGMPSESEAYSAHKYRLEDCIYVPPRGGETCILEYYRYILQGNSQVEGYFEENRRFTSLQNDKIVGSNQNISEIDIF